MTWRLMLPNETITNTKYTNTMEPIDCEKQFVNLRESIFFVYFQCFVEIFFFNSTVSPPNGIEWIAQVSFWYWFFAQRYFPLKLSLVVLGANSLWDPKQNHWQTYKIQWPKLSRYWISQLHLKIEPLELNYTLSIRKAISSRMVCCEDSEKVEIYQKMRRFRKVLGQLQFD